MVFGNFLMLNVEVCNNEVVEGVDFMWIDRGFARLLLLKVEAFYMRSWGLDRSMINGMIVC